MPDAHIWTTLLPYLVLPALIWLTYWDSLKGTWLIDDQAGMAYYDGQWPPVKQDDQGNTLRDANGKALLDWARGFTWGCLFKKFRWEFGKQLNPKYKEYGQPPFLPHPRRHHRLSLIIASGVLVALYLFLSRVFNEHVAFLTCLLFAVHPFGPQVIAWMSGIGYLTGAFFMLVGLNFAYLALDAGWLVTPLSALTVFGGYGIFQFLAVLAMFQMFQIVWVLVLLKLWPFALVAALIAGFGALTTFLEAVVLRKKIFVEQQMGQETKFYPRKLIVVFKTLGYYASFMWFPKRMGLYHTYGYHYELPVIELEDREFWKGFVAFLICIGCLLWGSFTLQFAAVWFLAFICLFLNWVTIQQFVTERYGWLPSLSACLVVATYAPAWAFWALFGVALMRTWVHLPTYRDEWSFYYSNLFNFPESEVAMGNMGVAFVNRGMHGAGTDWWLLGTHLNPDYDVNWYNLSHIVRSRPECMHLTQKALPATIFDYAMRLPEIAPLILGRYFIMRAVRSRTCHFPTQWGKELQQLDHEISWYYRVRFQAPQEPIPNLEWQTQYAIQQLANPKVPYRNFWEIRLKGATQALENERRKLAAQPPPAATPPTPPAPPPAPDPVAVASSSQPILQETTAKGYKHAEAGS